MSTRRSDFPSAIPAVGPSEFTAHPSRKYATTIRRNIKGKSQATGVETVVLHKVAGAGIIRSCHGHIVAE